MNTKTMEGLVGAKTNMEMVNTPFRVYKQARLKGDTETMERAMGYVNEFSEKAESYKVKADEGMKEDAKDAREKAELERKKAIEKRREEREDSEKKLEESRAKNEESKVDSVEISEDGKVLQKEAVTAETVDAEVQSQKPAAQQEPVTYVKADTNIVETAPMKEMKGASVDCSV